MTHKVKLKLPDNIVRLLIFIIIFAFFVIINPVVASAANLASLLNNSVYIAIYALAMLPILVMGILDLAITSYGIFAAYATLIFCMEYFMGINYWSMLLLAAIVGAACAMCTGYLIYKLMLPGILVSVAMANIFNMALFLSGAGSGNVPGHLIPQDMFRFVKTNIFTAQMGKITISLNISVVMVAIFAVIMWFFLNKTTTGRNAFAIGGNYEAAKRMGINILKTYLIVFSIAGALSGVGMMQAYMKQQASISPLILKGSHGDALAAVIFGGTQLGNGKGGSVLGTMIGVLVITLIRSNLVMLGVPSYAQTFVIGILLLGSVVLAAYKDFNKE